MYHCPNCGQQTITYNKTTSNPDKPCLFLGCQNKNCNFCMIHKYCYLHEDEYLVNKAPWIMGVGSIDEVIANHISRTLSREWELTLGYDYYARMWESDEGLFKASELKFGRNKW